jgi:hypothetical protein
MYAELDAQTRSHSNKASLNINLTPAVGVIALYAADDRVGMLRVSDHTEAVSHFVVHACDGGAAVSGGRDGLHIARPCWLR